MYTATGLHGLLRDLLLCIQLLVFMHGLLRDLLLICIHYTATGLHAHVYNTLRYDFECASFTQSDST